MGTEKISVSDHITEKSDNFVIDMESCRPSKDVPANPRFSRSLCRKWSLRGGEETVIPSSIANEKSEKNLTVPSPSPRAAQGGTVVPEKTVLGATEQCSNPQIYHQITVSTTNMGTNSEGRYVRRNSLRRSSSSISWILDPKRILFVFATLSSIGTILLIYFTLSMGKPSADGGSVLDLQQ